MHGSRSAGGKLPAELLIKPPIRLSLSLPLFLWRTHKGRNVERRIGEGDAVRTFFREWRKSGIVGARRKGKSEKEMSGGSKDQSPEQISDLAMWLNMLRYGSAGLMNEHLANAP